MFGENSKHQGLLKTKPSQFRDARREMITKIAIHGRQDRLLKDIFLTNLDGMTCTCPASQIAERFRPKGKKTDKNGIKHKG